MKKKIKVLEQRVAEARAEVERLEAKLQACLEEAHLATVLRVLVEVVFH